MASSASILPPLRRRIAATRCYLLIPLPAVAVLIAVVNIMREYYYWSIFDLLPIAAVGWSFLWNVISIILLSKNRHIYHPGVDIAMDFIAWGLAWALGVIWLLVTAYSDPGSWCSASSYGYGYGYSGGCDEGYVQFGVKLTAASIMILIGAAHCAMFVMACRVTRNLKKAKKGDARVDTIETTSQEAIAVAMS